MHYLEEGEEGVIYIYCILPFVKEWFQSMQFFNFVLSFSYRLFQISMHNTFAQQNDVFAEDAILENSEGPIKNVHRIRKRIYSGILEGKF